MAIQTYFKLLALASLVCRSAAAIPAQSGYNLVWSDDFNGEANAPPNPNNWAISIGAPNNGNGESQIYSTSPTNVRLSGSGSLLIVPQKTANVWTSGRLEGKHTFTCVGGKKMIVEAQIKLGTNPAIHQQGIWPAFWALGESFKTGTPWPTCGEWDILESINGVNKGHGTLHCGTLNGGPCHEMIGLTSASTFTEGAFHRWTLIVDRTSSVWQQQSLTWLRDGVQFQRVTAASIGSLNTWIQIARSPYYLILDVAVGGMLPGNPNSATQGGTGSAMEVDYVAVWQQK